MTDTPDKKLAIKSNKQSKTNDLNERERMTRLIMETPSIEEKMLDNLTNKLTEDNVLTPEQCEQVQDSLVNIAMALDSLNQLQTVLLDRIRTLNVRVQALEEDNFEVN